MNQIDKAEVDVIRTEIVDFFLSNENLIRRMLDQVREAGLERTKEEFAQTLTLALCAHWTHVKNVEQSIDKMTLETFVYINKLYLYRQGDAFHKDMDQCTDASMRMALDLLLKTENFKTISKTLEHLPDLYAQFIKNQ